jgi:hypothetical protein
MPYISVIEIMGYAKVIVISNGIQHTFECKRGTRVWDVLSISTSSEIDCVGTGRSVDFFTFCEKYVPFFERPYLLRQTDLPEFIATRL